MRARWVIVIATSLVSILGGCGGGGQAPAGAAGSGGAPAGAAGSGGAPAGVAGSGGGTAATGGAGSAGTGSPTGGAGSGGTGAPVGGAGAGGALSDGGPSDAGMEGMDSASSDAPTGGDSADAGTSSDAPMGGSDGSDGPGRGTPEICSFEIIGAPSPMIPTVGVIDWSTDLQGLTEARIEFSLDDPKAGELNVGGGGPISVSERRALMLGLKPARRYTYRIVATAGKTICVSADRSLSTQDDPAAPALQRVAGASSASRARGFIVTCSYRARVALIIDADGEVVWRAATPTSCSRAHMDWDGKYMWMMAANAATGSPAGGTAGDVRRVLMDGTGEEKIAGLERSHHDFAVLPEGGAAFLVVGAGGYTDVVERAAGGTMRMVVHLDGIGYGGTSSAGSFHPNALRYYARNDGYTVGDLDLPGVVQFNRQGKVLWRATGGCGTTTPESQCADMAGTHGHQLLNNGNLIYFKANIGGSGLSGPSPVKEYSFATGGTPTATLVWSYVGANGSLILGDVQRLGNGNTLVTYSMDGVIAEVSPTAALVQTLTYTSSQFGYSTFRETLYGPPQ